MTGDEKPATPRPTTLIPLAPTSPPKEPNYECTQDSMEVPPPPGVDAGEECFIHLDESSFTVSGQNSINVPYKLCCPSSCKEDTGPPGPRGPPGNTRQ